MSKTLLIGIDGGATKVSGWTTVINEDQTFQLGDINVIKEYREYEEHMPSFKPVNILVQLGEMNEDDIDLTVEEKFHGKAYMYATADVIIELAERVGADHVMVGIGMPGLKSADKRGIVALANGPRMPEYCKVIEARVEAAGIEMEKPIHHLGSDADYCGIGEEYSSEGLFSQEENSYYLGGGTGVADALKLKGELLAFDKAKTWIAKSWEMKNSEGKSMERFASSSGIQAVYSEFSGITVAELNATDIYPPQIMALFDEDLSAKRTFNDVSYNIAKLLFERIVTIYGGWHHFFEFVNSNRADLSEHHPYRTILLNSIIIGQRLGDLLEESKGKNVFYEPFLEFLTKFIVESPYLDAKFKKHYLKDEKFNEDLIKTSKLREAPAIGAGVDAYLTYHGE
ncbi:MAG: ROK family protein [Candidatus Marinimicrobia bacterium]|nr:ROK family protein [Candidatus Neomarinimicrobiota bacterium]